MPFLTSSVWSLASSWDWWYIYMNTLYIYIYICMRHVCPLSLHISRSFICRSCLEKETIPSPQCLTSKSGRKTSKQSLSVSLSDMTKNKNRSIIDYVHIKPCLSILSLHDTFWYIIGILLKYVIPYANTKPTVTTGHLAFKSFCNSRASAVGVFDRKPHVRLLGTFRGELFI